MESKRRYLLRRGCIIEIAADSQTLQNDLGVELAKRSRYRAACIIHRRSKWPPQPTCFVEEFISYTGESLCIFIEI